MASSDDDEELKRAIAMSLQHADAAEVIDLVSDEDEDDDIKRAIAMSLQEDQQSRSNVFEDGDEFPRQGVSHSLRQRNDSDDAKITSTHNAQASGKASSSSQSSATIIQSTQLRSGNASKLASQSVASSQPTGLLGLDRKAMEQERLARLGKRKHTPSPERPSKQKPAALPANLSRQEGNQKTPLGLRYPNGTIKRTFGIRHPRKDDITIEEILEASIVNIAVLSTFQFEDHWFFDKLNPLNTKQILFMSAKGDSLRQKLRAEIEACGIPNFKKHFPPLPPSTNSMHSKFMLLFSELKLRFVIPTANLIQTDWGEVKNDWQPGVFENSVFVIDLPRRSDGKVGKKEDMTQFGRDFIHFLEKQEAPANIIEGVLKFDFSQTKHLAFVHSMAGYHTRASQHPTGLHGLANAVRNLKLGKVKHLELDYAASSLGALSESFVEKLYMAARGESPGADSTYSDKSTSSWSHDMRIYYPKDSTVRSSIGGPACGGIITLERAHYQAAKFPKQCLRDYKSTRPGLLSHNKLLFARGRSDDGKAFAWMYIGSANVSEAAWGNPGKGKVNDGKWLCRNWECGVLVPVPEEKLAALELDEGETPPMSVFEGTADVPFEYPGEEYSSSDQPWFFRA